MACAPALVATRASGADRVPLWAPQADGDAYCTRNARSSSGGARRGVLSRGVVQQYYCRVHLLLRPNDDHAAISSTSPELQHPFQEATLGERLGERADAALRLVHVAFLPPSSPYRTAWKQTPLKYITWLPAPE